MGTGGHQHRLANSAGATLLAVTAIMLLQSGPAFASGARAAAPPVAHRYQLAPSRVMSPGKPVDFRSASTRSSVTHPHLRRPVLGTQGSLPSHRQTGRQPDVASLLQASAASPSPSIETLTGPFGLGIAENISRFGVDQEFEPADTQVAAGVTFVVGMNNSTATIWTKSGALLGMADLNTLLVVPAGYDVLEPSLLYDPASRRWFATAEAFDTYANGQAYLAISSPDDPRGTWHVWTIIANPTQFIYSLPKIAVTSDKILLTWDEYNCAGAGTCSLLGPQLWTVDKGPAVDLSIVVKSSFLFGPGYRSMFPARVDPTTAAGYVLHHEGLSTGIFEVTGKAQTGLTMVEETVNTSPSSAPPPAQQPGGGQTIRTGDDRIASAFVRSPNFLIAAIGNGCTPTGDTLTRACIEIDAISTSFGASGIVPPPQLFPSRVAQAGSDVYDPAVAMDAAGNLFLTATESSPSMFPSMVAFTSMAPIFGGPLVGPQVIQPGRGIYNSIPCGGSNSWGYAAASPDPVDATDIWVAGQYPASASNSCSWASAMARLTVVGPAVSNATPLTGPPVGGTRVVISGHDFVPGNTLVLFGTIPSSNVVIETPNVLTATAPPHLMMPVPVTVNLSVTTPNGQAAAGQFVYVARPENGVSGFGQAVGSIRPGAPPPVAQFSNADVPGRRGRAATSRLR
jgi:IPT/TIG domain